MRRERIVKAFAGDVNVRFLDGFDRFFAEVVHGFNIRPVHFEDFHRAFKPALLGDNFRRDEFIPLPINDTNYHLPVIVSGGNIEIRYVFANRRRLTQADIEPVRIVSVAIDEHIERRSLDVLGKQLQRVVNRLLEKRFIIRENRSNDVD